MHAGRENLKKTAIPKLWNHHHPNMCEETLVIVRVCNLNSTNIKEPVLKMRYRAIFPDCRSQISKYM